MFAGGDVALRAKGHKDMNWFQGALTALGTAVSGVTPSLVSELMTCVIALALVNRIFHAYLRDLR